ncbi:Asp23/Gls24 family envelope stress response protein [Streptomyces sp. DH24]|uniref:Asp23/Gls24 family envelope stress response protein n=1 Tax=Streptomyces sp. DH24 TaxID=3040123 RepID=UPI002441E74A|nr:Asp23/Gls24 family envelope stress response protein [Streptomyces sp. DH24]MDG9715061.1 Asp23/Gls24 family envelope stress response protein [Streptomyces sp. DH24]
MSTAAEVFRTPRAGEPPGERGATRIADRVVAKIASQAAREALGAPTPDGRPPHATVAMLPAAGRAAGTPGGVARVLVHVELDYPCDIGARCREVRRQVAERVGTLVGMKVPEVAVRVERLHLPPAHGAAQGRTR